MLKTYLYIPEHLEEKIVYTAKTQKKSKASVMRLALEKGIKAIQHQNTASIEALFKIAELGKRNKVKGPKDSVNRFDEYLYGKNCNKNE